MTDAERERVRRYVARLDAQRQTLETAIESTVALARGLTAAEHDRDSQAVVRSGWETLEARPDFERMIHWSEPQAPDFQRVWRRLVERRQRQLQCPTPPTR